MKNVGLNIVNIDVLFLLTWKLYIFGYSASWFIARIIQSQQNNEESQAYIGAT